ncbi:MAG: hypothetical protein KAW88_05465 [Candidatus Cloacimonetes bacterium]|nr:hypothetical protein [Candidatus Cloacimonadota bacterium]
MVIFEIEKSKFVNMDNVFKFELVSMEDSDKIFWRFYAKEDIFCTSKEFDSPQEALTWLNMTIARAKGAEEIIGL